MPLTFDQIFENKDIKITNRDNDLKIFNYRYCDSNSSNLIKECKGIVVNDNKILIQTQPYTENICEKTDIEDLNLDEYDIFEAREGTVIRLFYFNKWYISTFNTLNAYDSKWGTKTRNSELLSFGEIFERRINEKYNSIDSFLNTLDKDNVYLFLLLPDECTRMVSDVDNDILLLEVYRDNKLIEIELEHFNKLKKLQFENIDLMYEYIENQDWRKNSGVILRKYTENSRRLLKVYNLKYLLLLTLRDQSFQDVGVRYLLLRTEDERKDIETLFPEIDFESYRNALNKATDNLLQIYLKRQKGEHIFVSPFEHSVLKYFQGEATKENFRREILGQRSERMQKLIHLYLE